MMKNICGRSDFPASLRDLKCGGASQPRAKARGYDDTAPPGLLPFRHRDFTSSSTDYGSTFVKSAVPSGLLPFRHRDFTHSSTDYGSAFAKSAIPPGLLPFRHRDFTPGSTDFGWNSDKNAALQGEVPFSGFPWWSSPSHWENF